MPDLTGTYTKDGATQQARTRAEAVQLKFDGWQRVPDVPVQRVRPPAATLAAAQPDGESLVPAGEGDAS